MILSTGFQLYSNTLFYKKLILITIRQGQNHNLLHEGIINIFVSYLELVCKFFFLFLELVHCLLIPASGLGLQITGSSRDDSRLLEQSTIQGYRLDTERGELRWKNG